MKVTQFTKENLKDLRNDINAALVAVAQKHGIDLSIGTISYSTEKATTRLTMETKACTESDGISVPKGASYLSLFDLPADAFEREFTIQGSRFRLTELKTNRPKNPCSITRVSDGKGFKCGADTVKRALERV